MIDWRIKGWILFFHQISKKELDRQRGKGLNHNPTRMLQVEKQIRQYEQQLNEIKRRLESIEVLCHQSSRDPSSHFSYLF